MRDVTLFLKDILAAIDAIEQFVAGMDLNSFKQNDLVSSAVIRKFEMIGEAARNVPESIKERYPSIPWKRMAGMRDRLIHFYFGVNHDLVWQTILTELPRLRNSIRQILAVLETESSRPEE